MESTREMFLLACLLGGVLVLLLRGPLSRLASLAPHRREWADELGPEEIERLYLRVVTVLGIVVTVVSGLVLMLLRAS